MTSSFVVAVRLAQVKAEREAAVAKRWRGDVSAKWVGQERRAPLPLPAAFLW